MSWPRVKLGELCSLVTKGTTPTSVGLDFSARGIPFLRVQNISNSNVSLEDALYIDHLAHETLGRSKIRPGDFLITIAGTIGRTAIVPQDFPESNCNQAVAIIRIYEDKLWPKFLLHWLSTDDALGQISGRKVTATISNLSLGQIKELEVPLPSLPEQKRIAAILDKADTIRRKRQQAIQLADDFLRAVFLDMFGDPVTNPKGWEIKLSGELFSLPPRIGTTTPVGGEGCLVVRVGEIGKPNINFNKCGRVRLSDSELEKFALRPGDTVLARAIGSKNQLGKASFFSGYSEDVYIDSHVMRLRPDITLCNPEWFYRFISSAGGKALLQKAGGETAVQFNVNTKQASSLSIPMPPIELQNEFVVLCQEVSRTKARLERQADEVEMLFFFARSKCFLRSTVDI
ncbi:restriction endonuclease subunit S [Pseudomonas putida]|nr:restriction endonuclease subunit S [Pseudomonas putida]